MLELLADSTDEDSRSTGENLAIRTGIWICACARGCGTAACTTWQIWQVQWASSCELPSKCATTCTLSIITAKISGRAINRTAVRFATPIPRGCIVTLFTGLSKRYSSIGSRLCFPFESMILTIVAKHY